MLRLTEFCTEHTTTTYTKIYTTNTTAFFQCVIEVRLFKGIQFALDFETGFMLLAEFRYSSLPSTYLLVFDKAAANLRSYSNSQDLWKRIDARFFSLSWRCHFYLTQNGEEKTAERTAFIFDWISNEFRISHRRVYCLILYYSIIRISSNISALP